MNPLSLLKGLFKGMVALGRGRVIVVSGPPGSGKTTYAKHIAEKLGLEMVSAGSIFRRIARERGISVVELNLIAERDPSIDILIDKMMLEKAKKGNVVLEGHLTAWIVAEYADLRLYLTAPFGERVRRIAAREGRDISSVMVETAKREFSEALRFMKYYGIDVMNLSIFDYVINTFRLSVDEVKRIIDHILETHF